MIYSSEQQILFQIKMAEKVQEEWGIGGVKEEFFEQKEPLTSKEGNIVKVGVDNYIPL